MAVLLRLRGALARPSNVCQQQNERGPGGGTFVPLSFARARRSSLTGAGLAVIAVFATSFRSHTSAQLQPRLLPARVHPSTQ